MNNAHLQSDSPSKSPIHLLAIVETRQEDRILCQAEGCGHSVYKRIHIIKVGAEFQLLGSSCFKRLYGHLDVVTSGPKYGSSDGRLLSAEERLALLQNTERFIAYLETERLTLERSRAQRLELLHQERAEHLNQTSAGVGGKEHPISSSIRGAHTSVHRTRVMPVDDGAGMRWMWARSKEEGLRRIENYKTGGQRTIEKDLVLRYYQAGTKSDPWVLAINIMHHHGISTSMTISILGDLALIEPLPTA